jgi:periplasmic protein CpxP/Spy
MSEETNAPRRRGFGFAALIAAVLIGAVGGGFASTAIGHGGFGPGHGGWGHHGKHGPLSDADRQQHAERVVGHLGWAIDATPDQKQKLTVIAVAMMKDLGPVHDKIHAAKGRAVELLRQPKTDRAALEALRAEQFALAEDASKRLAQGLADAADVLTPQQRAKLAEHWRF